MVDLVRAVTPREDRVVMLRRKGSGFLMDQQIGDYSNALGVSGGLHWTREGPLQMGMH